MVPVEVVEATAEDARRLLGWQLDEALLVAAATVWGLIEAHVRRVLVLPRLTDPSVVDVPDDLASVAITATCRLIMDPAQSRSVRTVNRHLETTARSGGFQGFTIAEQLVLNRYRRRML